MAHANVSSQQMYQIHVVMVHLRSTHVACVILTCNYILPVIVMPPILPDALAATAKCNPSIATSFYWLANARSCGCAAWQSMVGLASTTHTAAPANPRNLNARTPRARQGMQAADCALLSRTGGARHLFQVSYVQAQRSRSFARPADRMPPWNVSN